MVANKVLSTSVAEAHLAQGPSPARPTRGFTRPKAQAQPRPDFRNLET